MTKLKRSDIPTVQVLKACDIAHRINEVTAPGFACAFKIISAKTQYPKKIILAAMQREYDQGNIDYGVSLATAWITPKGKQKLQEIKNELVYSKT